MAVFYKNNNNLPYDIRYNGQVVKKIYYNNTLVYPHFLYKLMPNYNTSSSKVRPHLVHTGIGITRIEAKSSKNDTLYWSGEYLDYGKYKQTFEAKTLYNYYPIEGSNLLNYLTVTYGNSYSTTLGWDGSTSHRKKCSPCTFSVELIRRSETTYGLKPAMADTEQSANDNTNTPSLSQYENEVTPWCGPIGGGNGGGGNSGPTITYYFDVKVTAHNPNPFSVHTACNCQGERTFSWVSANSTSSTTFRYTRQRTVDTKQGTADTPSPSLSQYENEATPWCQIPDIGGDIITPPTPSATHLDTWDPDDGYLPTSWQQYSMRPPRLSSDTLGVVKITNDNGSAYTVKVKYSSYDSSLKSNSLQWSGSIPAYTTITLPNQPAGYYAAYIPGDRKWGSSPWTGMYLIEGYVEPPTPEPPVS